jgi:hypothetical protein
VEEDMETRDTRILYDWSSDAHQPADGMALRLFPEDGSIPLAFRTNNEGYTGGRLPADSYQALAFNTEVEGVELTDTTDYEGAMAHALPQEGMPLIDGLPLMRPVGWLYAAYDGALRVTSAVGTEEHHLAVHPLSAHIQVNITNLTSTPLDSVRCLLRGLVLSRQLCGGTAHFDEGMGAYRLEEAFDADGRAAGVVPCLGVYNPNPTGSLLRYDNLCTLDLIFPSHVVVRKEISLSEQLVEAMGGDDLSVAIAINLKLEGDLGGNLHVDVNVSPWEAGDEIHWGV